MFNAQAALEESLKKQRASFEQQMQAVSRQIASSVKSSPVPVSSIPVQQLIEPLAINTNQPDCPTLDQARVNEIISTAAAKNSLAPELLRAVMKQESGFKPCAVSVKGAQGLMQLMPGTARELGVSHVFDPTENVRGGAAYLRQLLDRYQGDLRLALIGYNAGPGRADQSAEAPIPFETENYVANVFADLNDAQEDEVVREDLAPVGLESGPAQQAASPRPKP